MKNLLRAIPLSFYSQTLYREIGQQWKGFGLLYILLVLALLLVPITMHRISKLNSFLYGVSVAPEREALDEIVQEIAAQIPEMRIKNGILTVENVTQPYTIANPRTQVPLAVIDTTGVLTSLENQAAPILFTAKAVIVHSAHGGSETIHFTELAANLNMPPAQEMIINAKTLEQWRETITLILALGPYVMGFSDLLAGLIAFSLRAVLFAGFAALTCALLRKELRFSTLIRLAAVASTPVMFSEMLSILFGSPLFANKNLVYFLMHSAYLYHAVEANFLQKPDGL